MHDVRFDVLVVGGGAAGLAAACEVRDAGYTVVIVERENVLGGILLQCIHNGFGLTEFREELTGPEYAERFVDATATGTEILTDTTVVEIENGNGEKVAYCYSGKTGVTVVHARAVVLAMGCRERNRGNVRIPGTRPAGVMTAGLAQRLVNIDGLIPGREVVIVGSGDIGLIMARRMTWAGCTVHAVVEIQPYPSGLTRNIVQCLNDFKIPLYLSHIVSRIDGRDRVTSVDITPVESGSPNYDKTFAIPCDTVLLSVGLVPENELSKQAGVEIDPTTNGPIVDARLMTSVDGIFAAGNVLHVHDLVDYVSEEARRAGAYVVKYLGQEFPDRQLRVKPGANVRYVRPGKCDPSAVNRFYMRPLVVKNDATVVIRLDTAEVKRLKRPHIQPSEMITFRVTDADLRDCTIRDDSVVEVGIE